MTVKCQQVFTNTLLIHTNGFGSLHLLEREINPVLTIILCSLIHQPEPRFFLFLQSILPPWLSCHIYNFCPENTADIHNITSTEEAFTYQGQFRLILLSLVKLVTLITSTNLAI